MENLILFRVVDSNGQPVPNAVMHGVGGPTPPGHWDLTCNKCGEYAASITPDTYQVTISAPGFHDRTLPMTLQDSGIITEALERDFPEVPTRADVCNFVIPMQGYTAVTKEFGTFPSFGIETSVLSDEDLDAHCQQIKALGCTHAMFCWSWRYVEPGFSYPVPGRDLTTNFPEIRRRLEFLIQRMGKVVFFLSGDGLSNPQRTYNDPQGWTYGYEWLCERFPALATYLQEGHDITKYILFMPGFDSVFYGWGIQGEVPDLQPFRVNNFGKIFRTALPNGYLGIEHTPGNIPVGEGAANFQIGGPMDPYDTVASEYSWPNIHNDATWQVVGRMVPDYVRPPDEPGQDDPRPPFDLLPCPRGPRAYVAMEYKTYGWVRGMPLSQIVDDRNYLRAMNATNVC